MNLATVKTNLIATSRTLSGILIPALGAALFLPGFVLWALLALLHFDTGALLALFASLLQHWQALPADAQADAALSLERVIMVGVATLWAVWLVLTSSLFVGRNKDAVRG